MGSTKMNFDARYSASDRVNRTNSSALSRALDVVRSPGKSLVPETRAFMESRFGDDFSQVRVHTDGNAAESAKEMHAIAYTVGQDLIFGAGHYSPHSHEGRELLAHELAHAVQQKGQKNSLVLDATPSAPGEQEAEAAAHTVVRGRGFHPAHHTPTQIARKPASGPTAGPLQSPMKRAEFDKIMKDRYHVVSIRTGTFQDQAFGDMKENDWKPWDPDPASTVYNWIAEAFANFEKAFGGLPDVKRIIFFDAEYHRDDQGTPLRSSDVGASYGKGQLTVYSAVQKGNKMFNLQGVLESPTSEQATKRNITHELGHGIAETALTQGTDQPPGADPGLFNDYRRTVGWTKDEKLYDIQEKEVQDAFAKNAPPPAKFQITPDNVNKKPPWKELPVTRYMADNPADDFSEAIMAYVNEPERLKAHSPTRYEFIDKRKARWLATGQPKMNVWEQAKRGGRARTLKPSEPSRPPTIWERAKEAK